MINLSLDDPEFFQKLNASRPDLFDQEKMAKNIEDERSYPMQTDRLQTIDELLDKAMEWQGFYDEAMALLPEDTRQFVDSTSWAGELHKEKRKELIKAALSAMVAEIIGGGDFYDSKEAKAMRAEQRQRAAKMGFKVNEEGK